MTISQDDVIDYEMEVVFKYKNAEVTIKCYNDIRQIKIVGISDNGIIEKTKAYIGNPCNTFLLGYLNNISDFIEEYYKKYFEKDKKTFDN
jgi:hypothetical protein